jgi:hypothetical protein
VLDPHLPGRATARPCQSAVQLGLDGNHALTSQIISSVMTDQSARRATALDIVSDRPLEFPNALGRLRLFPEISGVQETEPALAEQEPLHKVA